MAGSAFALVLWPQVQVLLSECVTGRLTSSTGTMASWPRARPCWRPLSWLCQQHSLAPWIFRRERLDGVTLIQPLMRTRADVRVAWLPDFVGFFSSPVSLCCVVPLLYEVTGAQFCTIGQARCWLGSCAVSASAYAVGHDHPPGCCMLWFKGLDETELLVCFGTELCALEMEGDIEI